MTDFKPLPPDDDDDDDFDRDLQEIMEDRFNHNETATPNINGGTTPPIHGGTTHSVPTTIAGQVPSAPMDLNAGGAQGGYGSGLPGSRLTRSYTLPAATTNIPLYSSGNTGSNSAEGSPSRDFLPKSFSVAAQNKLEFIKEWSVNTFKTTRQFISERFGKGSKTVDLEMEASIENLRDMQRKYANILRLAQGMSLHFYNVVQTQKSLGESFSELAQKSPELQEEFMYNCETQRTLVKNGEILLAALSFFTSSVNTLVNKTIEDTMLTIRSYETARLEYDAYRTDYESLEAGPREAATQLRLQNAKRKFEEHKLKFERLRGNVHIKIRFLDENRVKVMHKHLLLFHNAISAYFSGNAGALEATLKQFNIHPKCPNTEKTSWLES